MKVQPVARIYNLQDRKKPKPSVKEVKKPPFRPPDNIA